MIVQPNSEWINRDLAGKIASDLPKVTWISAPAGSGKTSLASQIVGQVNATRVWLQLDAAHGDVGLFIALLASKLEELREATSSAFAEAKETSDPLATLVNLLVNVTPDPDEKIILVADDFHRIGENSQTARLLGQAFIHLPPNIHLIVISRLPRFPSFIRAFSEGYVRDVTFEDLKFSTDELSTMIDRFVPSSDIPKELRDEILGATGGWVLACRLLLELSKSKPNSIRILDPVDHASLFDLLNNEVFCDLSQMEMEVLSKAAALPDLPEEIANQLLDRNDANLILRNLSSQCMLVSLLPNNEFSLHDLVRGALKSSPVAIEKSNPEFLAHAAEIFLEHGYLESGLKVVAASKNWKALCVLVERHANPLITSGRFAFLCSLINLLPEELIVTSPQLRFWRGLGLQGVDTKRAGRELRSLYFDAKSSVSLSLRIKIWGAAIDATWNEWPNGDVFDPLIAEIDDLRDAVITEGVEENLSCLTRGAFAALSYRDPTVPGFSEWEERNLSLFLAEKSRAESVRRGIQLMNHYTWGTGDRAKASIVRERLRNWLDEDFCPPIDKCAQYTIEGAYHAWFGDSLDKAVANGKAGTAMTASLGMKFADVLILNATMYKLLPMEDTATGWTFLKMIADRNRKREQRNNLAIEHHLASYLHWIDGNIQQALISGKTAYGLAQSSGFYLSSVYYAIGFAAILFSAGELKHALQLQSKARHLATAAHSDCMTYMALMLGAANSLQTGNAERTLLYLKPAMQIGARQRYYSIPWVRKGEALALLALAEKHRIEPDYAVLLAGLLGPVCDSEKNAILSGQTVKQDTAFKRLHIHTLGQLDIMVDSTSQLTSRKMQRGPLELLLYLVAAGPAGVRREALIDMLWPDGDVQTGRDRLKVTIYRLRRLLKLDNALVNRSGQILLDPNLVSVDSWIIEQMAKEGSVSLIDTLEASSLYRGPFYQDLDRGHEFVMYRNLCNNAACKIVADGLSLAPVPQDESALGFLEFHIPKLEPDERTISAIRQGFKTRGWHSALGRLEEIWNANTG